MIFFMLMKIVCAALIISTFVNSENTSTNSGNVTENEDAAIASGICSVWNTDCKNGGTCIKQGNYNHCTCREGTSGYLCEIVDACENRLCGYSYNAKCYFDVLDGKAVCKCLDENSIFDHERKTCRKVCNTQNLCKNGGSCVNVGNYSVCSCLDGTKGELCEIVDDCNRLYFCGTDGRSVCYFDIERGKAACRCDGKDTVYDAERRVCRSICGEGKHICSNGGTCRTYDQYNFCSCPNGTSGDLCQIVDECNQKSNLCGHSAECYFDQINGKAACRCRFETQIFDPVSKVCRRPCDPVNNVCEYGGSCEGHGNYMFCSCLNGTYGDFCQIVRDCEDPFFCGNRWDAQCYFDESKEAAACKCTDGKFYYTEKKICIRECDKRNKTCRNGGSCIMHGKARICACPEGISGDFCEIIAGCKNSTLCGYDNNAECYYDELNKTAACRCKDKRAFFDKDRKACRKHCNGWNKGEWCKNGGLCSSINNQSYCHCLSGTSGDFCETVNECKYNNLCGTSKGVECYFNPVKGEASCRCRFDGAVYDPKRKICTSECDRNPCQNGGTCSINNGKVKCICKFSYSGDYCESDGRSNMIGAVVCSIFAAGIFVSILTSCCALRSIQKVQGILEKTNGV